MGNFLAGSAAWISLAPAAIWAGLFLCLQVMTAYSPDVPVRSRRPVRISPVAWAGSAMLCLAWVAAVLTTKALLSR